MHDYIPFLRLQPRPQPLQLASSAAELQRGLAAALEVRGRELLAEGVELCEGRRVHLLVFLQRERAEACARCERGVGSGSFISLQGQSCVSVRLFRGSPLLQRQKLRQRGRALAPLRRFLGLCHDSELLFNEQSVFRKRKLLPRSVRRRFQVKSLLRQLRFAQTQLLNAVFCFRGSLFGLLEVSCSFIRQSLCRHLRFLGHVAPPPQLGAQLRLCQNGAGQARGSDFFRT
mmetsp:Transcript_30029/g.101237  ORF Transcript_30029/g.101237 Transcript_30029/m.101237 type:complete len:230 (+) Transcript_30029:1368-2057(+)